MEQSRCREVCKDACAEFLLTSLELTQDSVHLVPFYEVGALLADKGVNRLSYTIAASTKGAPFLSKGMKVTRSRELNCLAFCTSRLTTILRRAVWPALFTASRRKSLSLACSGNFGFDHCVYHLWPFRMMSEFSNTSVSPHYNICTFSR